MKYDFGFIPPGIKDQLNYPDFGFIPVGRKTIFGK
jgi:hypothetical protein